MKFAVHPHQGKEQPYANALISAGWQQVEIGDAADLLLTNSDLPHGHWRSIIDAYTRIKAKIVTYPDGALPFLFWDGMHKPWHVNAATVIAPGHAEVMRRYQCPVPTFTAGWAWSGIRDFTPTQGKKVLFAPLHPDGYGFLDAANTMCNRDTFAALLALDIDLTVRHLGNIEQNGLWVVPDVIYKAGKYDNSFNDILNADVVVSAETYAYMSVALGKPTVIMHRDIELFQHAAHYADYADYLEYPFTFTRGFDMGQLIHKASFTECKEWKDRFIGWSFDPVAFADWIARLYERETA